MKKSLFILSAAVALASSASIGNAQNEAAPADNADATVKGPAKPGNGTHTVVPRSSEQRPEDKGQRAHTNVGIVVPNQPEQPVPPK